MNHTCQDFVPGPAGILASSVAKLGGALGSSSWSILLVVDLVHPRSSVFGSVKVDVHRKETLFHRLDSGVRTDVLDRS